VIGTKDIETVRIEGKEFVLYIDVESAETLDTQMGISVLPIGDSVIEHRLARKIAEEYQVTFWNKNFGGCSSGNPPSYGFVFSVRLKNQTMAYTPKPITKETKQEFKEAKEKLISATTDLMQAIEKEVESILLHLPKWKRDADLTKIRELTSKRHKSEGVLVHRGPSVPLKKNKI
jgi:hypothetical protein